MFIGEYSYADDLREHYNEAIEIGLEKGREQKSLEDAEEFLANGVSVEIVAKSLHMPVEKVEELAEALAR